MMMINDIETRNDNVIVVTDVDDDYHHDGCKENVFGVHMRHR